MSEKIISLFIGRPVAVGMLFLVLGVLGLVSFLELPVSLMPAHDAPFITIVTRYSGMSPGKIDELITRPVEEQLFGLGGVENIYSSSAEGESRINIRFKTGTRMARVAASVREKLDQVSHKFPREADEPSVLRHDPNSRPVFVLALKSNTIPLPELREIAEHKIQARFERVPGVGEVRVEGGRQREILVNIKQNSLRGARVGIDRVMNALSSANTALGAGTIIESGRRILIRVDGRLKRIDDIRDVAFNLRDGAKHVRLGNIADITDSFREPESITRRNGSENISIYVQRSGAANILDVCENLKREVDSFSHPEIKLRVTYNQSDYITKAIARVRNAAFGGGFIAVCILLIFLRNFRATILVAVTVPFSVLTTFGIMRTFGVGLNVLSLSGLALGVGMLLDNAIVFTEQFFQKSSGSDIREKGSRTIRMIMGSLVAGTFTTICVFIPVLFVGGETRELYSGLAVTISGSQISSLLVSIVLLPVLAGVLFRNFSHFKRIELPFFNGLGRIKTFLPELHGFNTWKRKYRHILILCFRRPTPVLLGVAVLVLSGLFLIPFIDQAFIEPGRVNRLSARVELPTGTHLDATDRKIKKIEAILKGFKSVKNITSKIERWSASLDIELVPYDRRSKSTEELIPEFIAATAEISGTSIYFTETGAGQAGRELDVDFIGGDSSTLREIARRAAAISSRVPGVQQAILRFRDGKPELRINFSHSKASQVGVSAREIGSGLQTSFRGAIPIKYFDAGKEVDIRVQLRASERQNTDQVADLRIQTQGGAVPIGAVSSITRGTGDTRIFRKNKRKTITITLKLNDAPGAVIGLLRREFDGLKMPADYRFEFGEQSKKINRTRRDMLFAVFLALFLVLAVLAALYESVTYPFLIIISIPFAASGVMWTIFITGMSLNIAVYIGLIMLFGIVVNNAIILVSQFIHQLKSVKGRASRWSVVYSVTRICSARLRPILMTTITTVAGMGLLLFDFGEGSEFWRPLAATVVSGLCVSTAMTLLIVPLLFVGLHPAFRARFSRVIILRRLLRMKSKKILQRISPVPLLLCLLLLGQCGEADLETYNEFVPSRNITQVQVGDKAASFELPGKWKRSVFDDDIPRIGFYSQRSDVRLEIKHVKSVTYGLHFTVIREVVKRFALQDWEATLLRGLMVIDQRVTQYRFHGDQALSGGVYEIPGGRELFILAIRKKETVLILTLLAENGAKLRGTKHTTGSRSEVWEKNQTIPMLIKTVAVDGKL